MLRLVFAVGLILLGLGQSLRGPFYALLFYLFIAYFRPELWIWSTDLEILNLSFYVGLYAVASTVFFGEVFEFKAPVWIILIFCLHGLGSTMLSDYYDWCMIWWQGFAKVSVICVLIIGLVKTQERLRLTMLVIVFSLGFESVKQGWFHLILAQGEQNLNDVAILGDNNGVAVGMLMAATILLALFQTSKGKLLKGLYAFMLLGVLFRSLTSYSRGGFLAFGAMCIMYVARSKNRFQTLVLVVAFGALLLPLLPAQYWDRMNTITENEETRDSSVSGRLFFWDVAQRMANNHPFFGVGTSGFQAAFNRYDPTDGLFGRFRAVHSMWFGILADQGYVGLVLLIILHVMAFRACGRARRAAYGLTQYELLFAAAAAIQTSIVTVAVGGTFLSYHYVEILWHFLALGFAVERVAVTEGLMERDTPRVMMGPRPVLQAS